MKYLIAGLGNIGAEYAGTRHNIGFEVVNALARKGHADFELARYAARAEIRHRGRQLVLIKPTTYMNLSGKAVRYWLQQEKVALDRLLVVVDDLALPFGTLRLKGKGSDGGHNGLRDIQDVLATTSYARLRFGIGDDFHRGRQVGYVLGRWEDTEIGELAVRIEKAVEMVESFCTAGLPATMNRYNNK